jgi:hypothetical protein
MKYLLSIAAISILSFQSAAQIETTLPIDTAKQHESNKRNLSIGSGGIRISRAKDENAPRKIFDVQFGMLDLGINTLQDNTNYNTAEARQFLHVDNAYANKDLFALRTGKSVNVNIYPVLVKANLVRTKGQKLILSTGLGLQLYNFRFNKPVSYRNDPQPYVTLDTVSFTKNKLAFNYLTVPLMLTSKTRIAKHGDGGKGIWVVYGAGISGGYRLSSWTKQISGERGKDKNHDPFNFSETNFCVNGEIGLDGFFRLFASYQLTALHENGLDQHPMSIGIRFLGI